MRYDKLIYMCTRGTATYDPETGDYIEAEATKTGVMASVNSTRTEVLQLVYGALKQGSYEVHLQNKYEDPFDYIEIDGKPYKADYIRPLRHKQSFVVSEAQGS